MVAEARWSFRSAGGPKGQVQLIWDERSDSGTPPPVVTLARVRRSCPSLGSAYTTSRPTTTSRPEEEQPELAAREDLVDHRRRRTPGATVRCQRGVFPSGFPRHVADLGPIHHSTVIPTAGGAASAAAAQPRIGATRGGCRTGFQGFRPRAVRVRVRATAHKMRQGGDSGILDAQ